MAEIEQVAAKRSQVHTRYYKKDGSPAVGVTTVLSVLAKPALVPWANNLGLAGIKVREYVDVMAQIGTIGHAMILSHHKNEKFDTTNLSTDLVDKAENCALSYFAWEKEHIVEPILCEAGLVSEEYGYGGTIDLYAMLDGVPTLIDYKTGKAIYPEHTYQATAYRQLLAENGHLVKAIRILQVGREESEGFSEKSLTDTYREWEIFKHCLALYKLKVGK